MTNKYLEKTNFPNSVECLDKYFYSDIVANTLENVAKGGESISQKNISPQKNRIRLKFQGIEYAVDFLERSSGHRRGDGGELEYISKLIKNEKEILISRRFLAYGTYSDDSTDYTQADIKETILLEEEPLARLVFEELKKTKVEERTCYGI
jgi:hypothetical protein